MQLRKRCIEILFEQSPLFISLDQFAQSLQDWTLEPVCHEDGEIAMIYLIKGAEFHFATCGRPLQIGRRHLNRLAQLLAEHGHVLTRTPKTDLRQQRFNQRLGFYPVAEDAFDIHYRIDHLRRKPSCPSSL